MPEPFEIRRRIGLYVVLAVVCFAVAAGYGWLAYDREKSALWALTAVFTALGLMHVRGLRDARTPLFVADDHGVRMRAHEGWVGLLWSEMGEIKVERRIGVRYDPRVKVVSHDGTKFYTSPLGLATNVSPGEAEVQLARRRSAAAY